MTTVDAHGNLHDGRGQFSTQGRPAVSYDLTAPAGSQPREVPAALRASAPDVSYEELIAMSSPTAPVTARLAAASTPYPGVASRAANDPDPLVRAIARRGWDLSDEDARRLDADPEVRRITAVMAGLGFRRS